jgi:hypothetical protein
LGRTLVDYRSFERWYFEIEAAGRAHAFLSDRQLSRLTELSESSLFIPYYDLVAAELIEPDRHDLDSKLALNGQALRFFPIPSAVFRQVLLLYLKGDHDASFSFLRRMAIIYPSQMPLFLNRLDRMALENPADFGNLAREARRAFGSRR